MVLSMVRYFCYTCENLLLKQIGTVIEHVWGKHGIEIRKNPSQSGFLCEECNLPFGSIPLLLNHIDKTHGIHIWYEKGLTKKRVFFDGILNNTVSDAELDVKTPISKHTVPLSKRPYEPRKKDEDGI